VTKTTTLAFLLATATLGAEAASTPAPPKAAGEKFRVSSCVSTSIANCRDGDAAVAGVVGSGKEGGGTDAGFLALWAGRRGSDLHAISARRFSTTSALGADTLLSPIAGDQYDPGITVQQKGTFVAVWSEVANGHSDVKAQRLSATGARIGAPTSVNVDDPAAPGVPDDLLPAVAPTKDGGFAVAWIKVLSQTPYSPTSPQVVFRQFDAAGTPRGPQIALSQGLSSDRPALCVDSAGNVNVAWASVNKYIPFVASRYGVSLRRLSPAGEPLAAEEVVWPPLGREPIHPSISCAGDDTFVVVWHADGRGAEGTDIFAQKYEKNGAKSGSRFVVNTVIGNEQRNPSIAHDATGAFVVVWETVTSTAGSRLGIFGRRYTAAGKVGPQFEVISHDVRRRTFNAVVAPTSDAGNFVVLWQNAVREVWGRRFTP